jgi:hypothetical protein
MIFGLGVPAAVSLGADNTVKAQHREIEVQWSQYDRFANSWLGICTRSFAGHRSGTARLMTSPMSGQRPTIMALPVTARGMADMANMAAVTGTTAASVRAATSATSAPDVMPS